MGREGCLCLLGNIDIDTAQSFWWETSVCWWVAQWRTVSQSVSHLNYWHCLPCALVLVKIRVLQCTKSISSMENSNSQFFDQLDQVETDTQMSQGGVLVTDDYCSLFSDSHCLYTLIFIVIITIIKALFTPTHTFLLFLLSFSRLVFFFVQFI